MFPYNFEKITSRRNRNSKGKKLSQQLFQTEDGTALSNIIRQSQEKYQTPKQETAASCKENSTR